MRVLVGCLIALLLSACVSLPKPLSPDIATRLKQGQTAVLFYDDVGQINYLEDKYFVLGVAQVGSNSAYTGIWNSGPELSELHAAQFAGLGLKARSAYSLLSPAFIEEHTAADRARYTMKPPEKSKSKAKTPARSEQTGAITPKLRDALLAQGQDSLIWLGWSGFTLHIHTLGVPPWEKLQTGIWMFDLKANRLLWSGTFWTIEKVSLGEQSGKQFLEANDLSGLKAESAARMRDFYAADKRKNADIGTLTGLRETAP